LRVFTVQGTQAKETTDLAATAGCGSERGFVAQRIIESGGSERGFVAQRIIESGGSERGFVAQRMVA
jgi:hypothetical protein